MRSHLLIGLLVLSVVVAFAVPVGAAPPRIQNQGRQDFVLAPQGLDVPLVFDQGLTSGMARLGDRVRLHVARDVTANRMIILRRGTPVTGVVSRVDKRKAFGVNASLRIELNPVTSLQRIAIPLEPRTTGKYLAGEKSGKAAAAAAGGAVMLGPVGLIGGYFIHGQAVTIHRGDGLMTEVASAVQIPHHVMALNPYWPNPRV